jgi:hypothetical protein
VGRQEENASELKWREIRAMAATGSRPYRAAWFGRSFDTLAHSRVPGGTWFVSSPLTVDVPCPKLFYAGQYAAGPLSVELRLPVTDEEMGGDKSLFLTCKPFEMRPGSPCERRGNGRG